MMLFAKFQKFSNKPKNKLCNLCTPPIYTAQNLKKKEVRFKNVYSFNDWYETYGYQYFKDSAKDLAKKEVVKGARALKDRIEALREDKDFMKSFNEEYKTRIAGEPNDASLLEYCVLSFVGVFCVSDFEKVFSDGAENTAHLMMAHYADDYKGIVLIYSHKKSDRHVSNTFSKINYQKDPMMVHQLTTDDIIKIIDDRKRTKISKKKTLIRFLKKYLYLKKIGIGNTKKNKNIQKEDINKILKKISLFEKNGYWEYEKEHRMLNTEGAHKISDVGLELRYILHTKLLQEKDYSKIKNILSEQYKDVELIEMHPYPGKHNFRIFQDKNKKPLERGVPTARHEKYVSVMKHIEEREKAREAVK